MNHTKGHYMTQPVSLGRLDGGWDLPEVAAAQAQLISAELGQAPEGIAPYAAFLRALDTCKPRYGASLLDVGCGVGHYATLLRLHRPELALAYVGMDHSEAMIEIAERREPQSPFIVRGIEQTDYSGYDLILHSVAAEVSTNTLALIACLLKESAHAFLIWNRIRLTGSGSGYIDEPTYAGHSGPIWIWNRRDLIGLLNLTGRRYILQAWPERADCLTAVIFPAGMGL